MGFVNVIIATYINQTDEGVIHSPITKDLVILC